MTSPQVRQMLRNEVESLMARLQRIKPFSLHMPMVAAAALPTAAQQAIDLHLEQVLSSVAQRLGEFQRWLRSTAARQAEDATAQRRLTLLRLRLQAALTQFDLFSDVLTQRSEHEFGVWLGGLDMLAADSLNVAGEYYDAPPAVCYLDRGVGAAIRRARTRLPGGGKNPVAVIRIPRERMIGAGIASSLVHEVGHQGAALLDLVASLRNELQSETRSADPAWRLWQRWISEIIADFWSVAQIGVGSTLGLMGVVSLPRAFVFRISDDGPHPAPWIRVMLSAAIGQALYPDPQWRRLREIWERFYPLDGLDPQKKQLLQSLLTTLPAFVERLVEHRPATLGGRSLLDIFPVLSRQPARLRMLFSRWDGQPQAWATVPPTLAFAVIGQARADNRLSAFHEANLIDGLLTRWAAHREIKNHQCGCSSHAATNLFAVKSVTQRGVSL